MRHLMLAATLIIGNLGSQSALGDKPVPSCEDRTVCPAVFYYNDNLASDVPVLNRHALVVLNQNSQLNALLTSLDDDTVILFYHLYDFCVENGPLYQWSLVDSHPSWFLLDDDGNRIRFPGVPLNYWYMDVGNAEYRQFKIEQYRHILATYPNLDGFFLDSPSFYGTPGPNGSGFARYTLPNLPCDSAGVCPDVFESEAAWSAFYLPALDTLRTALADALVLNNNFLVPPFNPVVDGSLGEDMFHPSFWGDGQFYGEVTWRSHVDALADGSLADRVPVILSGSTPSSNQTRWLRFTLASYLLGRRTDSVSLFSFSNADSATGRPVYRSLYDIDIGQPLGPCEQRGGTFLRRYGRGLAIVNPTVATRTVSLDDSVTYVDLDGVTVSGSVSLASNAGQILTVVGTASVRMERMKISPWLSPARPNPCRSGAVFSIGKARSSRARLELRDLGGRSVRILVDGALSSGISNIEWDGRSGHGTLVPDGIYFVRLQSEGKVLTCKVVVSR